jgi:hypothetical protein
MEAQLVEEGGNYKITRELGVCVLTVWRREDLTSAEGADLAERMVRTMRTQLDDRGVREVILDLSQAPIVMGPRTQGSIGGLIREVVTAKRKIRVVASPSAMGRMQLERMVRDHGAEHEVFDSLQQARDAR